MSNNKRHNNGHVISLLIFNLFGLYLGDMADVNAEGSRVVRLESVWAKFWFVGENCVVGGKLTWFGVDWDWA